MKRKSKPLITGGLLGLAGLGLLPRGAEANADLPPVVPEPSLGAARAKEPNPVVVPEPSAQTTEPQTDDQSAAQPAWTPESDQAVVIAAAAAAAEPIVAATPQPAAPAAVEDLAAVAAPQLEPTAVENPVAAAVIQPEPAVVEIPAAAVVLQPKLAAPEMITASENTTSLGVEADGVAPPAAIAVPATSAPAPAPVAEPTAAISPAVANDSVLSEPPPASALIPRSDSALSDSDLPEATDSDASAPDVAAIATSSPPATAVLLEAAETAASTPSSAELLLAIAPKPPVSKPRGQIAQRQEIAPLPSPPAAAIETALGGRGGASAPAPSPEGTRSAVSQPSPTANPLPRSSRQAAPDLATLRSRAAAVQALLQDLRIAYGLESQAVPNSPVSQPETLSRGPQLPQLSSRSTRRSVTTRVVAPPQKPAAISTTSQNVQPNAVLGPQLPLVPGQPPNVALALPTPKPVMSSRQAAMLSPVVLSAAPSSPDSPVVPTPARDAAQLTAQETLPASNADQVRNELRIEPLTTAADPAQTFPPSPNAGIPSAFGAEWGDVFISASLSGADRLRAEADGSLSMGFGIGDSRRAVGVEFAYNLQSIRQFGDNGGFDVKVHREVYSSDDTQVAAAVGWNNFASYGSDAAGTESSPYGLVTAAHLLQPDHPTNRLPITASLGLGGGNFGGDNHDVGVIAGVGLQVHPQFSINTAWSGVGVNIGASIVPVPTIPLTLNLLYGDVGNNTRAGSVAVLSIGYGFNFGPQF